jgi:hypothetical protein
MKPATAHKVIASGLTPAAAVKRGTRGRPSKFTVLDGGKKDDDDDKDDDDKKDDSGDGNAVPKKDPWPGGRHKTTGEPTGNYLNAWAGLLRLKRLYSFNLFRARHMIEIDDVKTPINDHLFDDLYKELQHAFRLNAKVEVVRQAMRGLCRQVYHPVREYLDGLRWDEQSRIDSWLAVAFGANSNNELIAEYISMVGRLTLLAAVRRIRRPGSKFDTTPVLRAPQGLGRSKALRILAVKNEWFADQLILSVDPKTQIEQLDGKWIYELSELEGMKGADNSKVKSFMSRQFDNGRAAYGHFAEERGRQNVFIGTVNEWHFLKDPTGNRRWWPIETTRVDLDWLRANVDQLWAEAVAVEKGLPLTDEALELPPHLWPVAQAIQDSHMVVDPWLELLRRALPADGKMKRCHSVDLIRDYIGKNPADVFNPYYRLSENIKKLGVPVVGPRKVRVSGKSAMGYIFFPDGSEPADDDDDSDPGDPPAEPF